MNVIASSKVIKLIAHAEFGRRCARDNARAVGKLLHLFLTCCGGIAEKAVIPPQIFLHQYSSDSKAYILPIEKLIFFRLNVDFSSDSM
jgi:hypothetical protein